MTEVPGLDLVAVAAYLDVAVPGLRHGPLRGQVIAGGRSNLTYRVTDQDHQWVLRRPPLGHVLATAHDMTREARVLTALAPTAVPVPRVVTVCQDPAVTGAPFYLMDLVPGTVLRRRADLARYAGAGAQEIADNQTDTLLALHAVDPAQVGLADLGRGEGYLGRQLRRWREQVAQGSTHDLAPFDALADRLARSLPPEQPPTLVHGDYRLDNLLIACDASVSAVLDWEMATIGDPLTDLANSVMWWDGIAGLPSGVVDLPGEVPGFPSSARLLERYVAGSGRDLSRFPWYLGLAFFKLAGICESIAYREQQGLTVGEGFGQIGALVPPLLQRGQAALEQ